MKTNKQVSIDLFNKFLRNNKAASKFYVNTTILINKGIVLGAAPKENRQSYKTVSGYLRGTRPTDFIVFAFNWAASNEGGIYWQQLDRKWCHYYKSINFSKC